jgi:beta-glucanase (GH16 family)
VLLETHSDEFDRPALDRGKWLDQLTPWGDWTWDVSLVDVSGGRLRLGMSYSPHERDGRRLYYRGGIVRSSAPPVRYGYFEARIKAAPRWPGVATAFWLFRETPEYWTEIDIVEMMQRRGSRTLLDRGLWVQRSSFAPKLPVHETSNWDGGWDPSKDFHVFSALWTSEEIRTYFDGLLVATDSNQYWHFPMDVVLSVGLRAPLIGAPAAGGFPTWMEVDYVRVWGQPATQ